MRPQQRPNRWNNFFALHWYDTLIEAIFKLAARSSEVLLAIGVILATANHIQHGELFTTPALDAHGQPIRLEDGSLHMTETALFGFWTWTQAIGFEASSGVVLVAALEARRRGDKVKRNILLSLVAGLSLVGTTMLIMAFVENVTGIKERELPTYYGITMGVLRSLVSVAYIMIGRIKHLRFSGPEDPLEHTPNALTQLATLGQQIERIEANTQHRLTELTERLNHLSQQFPEQSEPDPTPRPNTANSHPTRSEHIDGGVNILIGGPTVSGHSPNRLMEESTLTQHQTKHGQQNPTGTPNGANSDPTATRYIDEGANTHPTATQQSPGILMRESTVSDQSPTRLMEGPTLTQQRPNSHRVPGEDGTDETKEPQESETSSRIHFIESCLARYPNIRNNKICQMATDAGLDISRSHVSKRRKAFQSATTPDPPMEDEEG